MEKQYIFSKNKIKAVIFDMDGVLQDSESISDQTWIMASKEFQCPQILNYLDYCRGRNRAEQIQILNREIGNGFDAEKFLDRTSALFYEIEDAGGLHLMPYAKEILEYLKGKYRIALASSTRKKSVYRQMQNLGLFDYFETITTGDMVKVSKPDPEIYLTACKSLNLTPEECIAVEDSPNGIKSAYSAGIFPVMIPDKIKPDQEMKSICFKIFDSLKDLEKLL